MDTFHPPLVTATSSLPPTGEHTLEDGDTMEANPNVYSFGPAQQAREKSKVRSNLQRFLANSSLQFKRVPRKPSEAVLD